MRQSFPILHTEKYKVGRDIIFLLCINIPCFPHQGGGQSFPILRTEKLAEILFFYCALTYHASLTKVAGVLSSSSVHFCISMFLFFSYGAHLLIYLSLLPMTLKISSAFY